MKKYIFIKDESYSSNLYTNFIEYLSKDDNLNCSLGGSEKYKIKLMTTEEATSLASNHPMMLNTSRVTSTFDRGISLVSFGGCIYDLPIDKMVYQANTCGVSILASFAPGTSEADILYGAKLFSEEELKKVEGGGFVYVAMVNLRGTDLYYLILNPTLVRVSGHIEIEGDPYIEHLKGVEDCIKNLVFPMYHHQQVVANHIISGGLCVIDVLKDSAIDPEDREEFFRQLDLKVSHRREGCSHINSDTGIEGGTHIALAHTCDTPFEIEITNQFLGNYINDKEKLKWEYIVTSLGD